MNLDVEVVCPYCGMRVWFRHKRFGPRRDIILCSNFQGDAGCGREFVAETTITVTAVGLKIEGEENKKSR